ncbi:MAG TPA: hypothetical protein VES61_03415 [Gaiellaceae bacterium]|nr:hypothetical protein [Gaiellaceae bacterium]
MGIAKAKRGTALLVAAVVGLGIAAGVDALRGDGDPAGGSASSKSDQTSTASAAQKLASRQITGVLHFTVRVRPGQCALRSLALPGLEATSAVDVGSCRIATSLGGRVAVGGPCPGGDISVLGPAQPVLLKACAPAWKPDGTLTFVRRDRVIEVVKGCTGTAPADCLRRTSMRTGPGDAIRELAWIDDERLAMLVDGPGSIESVFVSEAGGRIASRRSQRPELSFRDLSNLRPFGRNRVMVRTGPPPGRVFLTIGEGGIASAFPRFLADGQALAVSPDGAWVASTRAGVVHIYRLGNRRPVDPIRLAIDAVDLGWGAG